MTNFTGTDARWLRLFPDKPPPKSRRTGGEPCQPHAIVSYDDTPTDHDALMFAGVSGGRGRRADPDLRQACPGARATARAARGPGAEKLLQRGARVLGDLDVNRRIVVNPSTAQALRQLAEQERADIVVFGSDYRTAAGHVSPRKSAEVLLEGAPAAVAIAPANYRSAPAIRAPAASGARRSRRRRGDRDGARARRRARRPRDPRRAVRRLPGDRLAARGAGGSGG